MRLRALTPGDADFYAGLYGDAETMRWIGAPLSAVAAARSFAAALRLPADRLRIVELDQPLALLSCERVGAALELGIIVAPHGRRRGIAAAALRQCIDAAPGEPFAMRIAVGHVAMESLAGRLGFAPAPGADRGAIRRWLLAGVVRGPHNLPA